ncbi:MAG: Trk system potassium transporter TrkA [Clostridia bacterium]|nr:Trk system potassium transporter TrkA [Clostridia bacterium]
MKIVIVGCGSIGTTLIEKLSKEGNDVVAIDLVAESINAITESYDVLGVVGNGATFAIQKEAGVDTADLLIAVTNSDELNLLCCMIAKRLGNCQTICRVRNPVYNSEVKFLKKELGIALVINPEFESAREISKLLSIPSVSSASVFANGNVQMLRFKVKENSILAGLKVIDIPNKLNCDVLVGMVERGEEVYIPNGQFEILLGDVITVIVSAKKTSAFFRKIKQSAGQVKSAIIVGGGRITRYLARRLIDNNISVKIVEKDYDKCLALSSEFPEATVINGDGMNRELIEEEEPDVRGGFVALTNSDEQNVFMSLYAKSQSKNKVITKISKLKQDGILGNLQLDSYISPKNIAANTIIGYVRAMKNSLESEVESLYKLSEDRVEALEFIIKEGSPVSNVPIHELKLKKNLLIACIVRDGDPIIPRGSDKIIVGDTVIVITTNLGFNEISDILED